MNTKTILMTVSFATLMTVSVPAMADSTVLCSVRQSMKGAAYEPGVDVKGKPVVGADVNSSVASIPKSMTIPLTVDLAQAYNTVLPAGGKLEAQVGLVEVRNDGKVIINGKDFTGPTEAVCSSSAVEARNKAAALRTKDAPKAKRRKSVEATADVPPVEAAPAAPVAAPEPAPAPAPAPEPAPAPAPAPEAAPAQPQVLDAQPPALPAPTPLAPEAAVPQPVPVAPPAPDAAPVPPPSGAIVSPTEGMPRPPMDPLAPPSPAPAPAPAPGGTLSGGSQ